MDTREIERRANELADRFINGNRTFVARDILTEDAPVAASLAAHVAYALCEADEPYEPLPPVAAAFLIFLERERDTVEGWR